MTFQGKQVNKEPPTQLHLQTTTPPPPTQAGLALPQEPLPNPPPPVRSPEATQDPPSRVPEPLVSSPDLKDRSPRALEHQASIRERPPLLVFLQVQEYRDSIRLDQEPPDNSRLALERLDNSLGSTLPPEEYPTRQVSQGRPRGQAGVSMDKGAQELPFPRLQAQGPFLRRSLAAGLSLRSPRGHGVLPGVDSLLNLATLGPSVQDPWHHTVVRQEA